MLNSKRTARLAERGMTLTEIMIVLAIISMIMGFVGFVGFGRLQDAKRKDTRIVMQQLKSLLVQWQAENNENCPGSLADLTEKKKEPKDGWNHPFTYKCPGEHDPDIDIVSKGPDGKDGTEDDLKSWEEESKKK